MCKTQTTISVDETVLNEVDSYVDKNVTNRSEVIETACRYWLEHAPNKPKKKNAD